MRATTVLLLVAGVQVACAQAPQRQPSILPLRSVRLYETGVAYFERSGPIYGDGTMIPVPPTHVDDALKTLVVVGSDGHASVDSVEFASHIGGGMARALAGLDPNERQITYRRVLGSMVGSPVELSVHAKPMAGRLIDVTGRNQADEQSGDSKPKPGANDDDLTLVVLASDSGIRRISAKDVDWIKPSDPVLAARFSTALDTLAVGQSGARTLLHLAASSGAPVTIGYVAEVPVWRSSYRIVFDSKTPGATLQGWALVHNDTDEDWDSVRTQLVNGSPESFLYPLAVPGYGRRRVESAPAGLSAVPQLLEQSVEGQMWGDSFGEAAGAEAYGLGSIGTAGYGSGSGRYGGRSHTRGEDGDQVTESGSLVVGNLAKIDEATGAQSGALFSYTLAKALNLRAHSSSLMPFLQRSIEARRVVFFCASGETGRSAILLTNTTGQTIPAGPVSFFETTGFAGEGKLDRLAPQESRFIEFGSDPDISVRISPGAHRREAKKLTHERRARAADKTAQVYEHFVKYSDLGVEIENRSQLPREVVVALPIVANATATGADELQFEPVSKVPLAVFRVGPHQTLSRVIKAEEGLSAAHNILEMQPEDLDRLAKETSLPADQTRILTELVDRLRRLTTLKDDSSRLAADAAELEKDLIRLQDHLKAMGGEKTTGAHVPNPFVARIVTIEDRLSAIRRELQANDKEREKVRSQIVDSASKLPAY